MCLNSLHFLYSVHRFLGTARMTAYSPRCQDSHGALFDHGADIVQVVSEATNRQTQHLNFCLCPLGPVNAKHDGLNTSRQTATTVVLPSLLLFELCVLELVSLCNCVSYPAGLESDTGCSCIVSSPSLVKAAPAAEKISPTCSISR